MAAAGPPVAAAGDAMLQQLMERQAAAERRYDDAKAEFKAAAAKWEANLDSSNADDFKLLMDEAKADKIKAGQLLDEANEAVKDVRARVLGGPGPAGALPPVDDRTVQYWQAALRGDIPFAAYETLQLPTSLAGSTRPVFVRESYVELANVLRQELQVFGNIGKAGNATVYGTPGIGKSVFASLLVAWIGTFSPLATVLYTAANTDSSDKYLVFSPDGSVRYMSAADGQVLRVVLGNSQEERLVWVVADGQRPPSGALVETNNSRLRTVLVSSSNMGTKAWLREWHKHSVLHLLAPPFSWDEVERAAEARQMQEDPVHLFRRFVVFGGVPRYLFESKMDPDEWLRQMVPLDQPRLLRILNDTAEGLQTQGSDNSRVVHLYPPVAVPPGKPRLDYDSRQARFASHVAAALVVANLGAANKREVVRRLELANMQGDGAVVALLFEPWMHAKLKRGQLFVAPGAHPSAVMPAPVESCLFPRGTTLVTATVGVYMEPQSKSFPSVDSFVRLPDARVLLFQMTGQASHPVSMSGLKKLFDVPARTPGGCDYGAGKCVFVPPGTTLVFVLMPRRLDTFAVPQPFVGKSGGTALQCTHNPEKYIAERLAQAKVAPHSFELE